MTEPDSRYPVPDRSDHSPQQHAHREFYPELDIGRGAGVMPDGRPFIAEDWFDKDLQIFCRTVFYSILDIENWGEGDHYRFIEASGLLADKRYPGRSAAVLQISDAAGNAVFSISVVIDEPED